MNSQSASKSYSHTKSSKAKTTKNNRKCTRIPTIQCHEEVMSKLSNGYSDKNIDEPAERKQFNCVHHNHKRENQNELKAKDLNCRGVYESSSAPVSNGRLEMCNSAKSKSISTVQRPNLEDSVDFIPVKLSSNNPKNSREIKEKQGATIVCNERSFKPTWDQLLRGKASLVSQRDKSKNTLSKTFKSTTNNFQVNDGSSVCTKKKLVISEPVKANFEDSDESLKDKDTNVIESYPLFGTQYSTDPVKALDLLIKQLRGKLIKQQNEKIQNIIEDMENALLKISVENQINMKDASERNIGNIQQECYTNVDSRSASNCSDEKRTNGSLSIAQLQKGLEDSCNFLQALCIKQREKCNNHTLEKEQLTIQLAESRRLLAIAKSREKDYEVKLGELRLKLQEANSRTDQQNQLIKELNDKIFSLKSENEALKSLQEALKRLNVRLKETSREKEILQSKLCIKDLEIEKLKVLLDVKNQIPVSKTIQDQKEEFLNEPKEDKDISTLSLSSAPSWDCDKQGLLCSSQASSSPRQSPSPYNSWQHISSICEQPAAVLDINRGIAEIFQNLKRKSEQNEPLKLDLERLSSDSNSFWSDKEDSTSKITFSDCELENLSS